MTNHALLTLHGVSYQLPDGSVLFDDLHEQFDARPTGLVGRNGVGKTVLARILAGELAPTRGRCERHGRVRYLAQRIAARPQETVADLAGVRDIIAALRRIEAGSTRPEDFDTLAERWDIEQRLQEALAANGLAHLHADTPATTLSGGEATQIALLGALLSDADLLIVDEPSNHLDREHRHALREQLRRWPRGLIVVSHDRELLADMQRIVELSAHGLRSYGGDYAFYAQAKADEQARAQHELAHRKAERRREARELDAQRERLERRQSRGAKQAAEANQAPILLGLQKSRAENSSGRLRQQQEAAREAASQRVRDAAARVDDELPVVLFAPEGTAAAPRRAAELRGVTLPHLRGPQMPLDLQIGGTQRIALSGANGSGKSTLLKVLAGQLPPAGGSAERYVETVYLDQQMAVLDEQQALLAQLLAANRDIAEPELRARLALLGLTAEKIMQPPSSLSGGERLKAALARALYSERPAQLLLLDEPDNHLDLVSLQALEAMLRQYRGALVVVSHDAAFLAALELDHGLERTARGWALTPWPAS